MATLNSVCALAICRALRDRHQQLVDQLQQLEDRSGDPNGVEIPPHY